MEALKLAHANAWEIEISIRNVYGNELVYPMNEKAKVFAKLLGRKTLTERDLDHIKSLGFALKIIPFVTSLKI